MKCNKTYCEYFEKPVNFPDCMLCIHMIVPRDNYKPKIVPLRNPFGGATVRNLFDGAPVMVRHNCSMQWTPRYYKSDNNCYTNGRSIFSAIGFCFWEYIRLPTIEESPRNEWLAVPCDRETQIELGKLNLSLWYKEDKYPVRKNVGISEKGWEDIKKVMILDNKV